MPHPEEGESKSNFIKRCIPYILDEGTASHQKQAVAICYSIWNRESKESKQSKQSKAFKYACCDMLL